MLGRHFCSGLAEHGAHVVVVDLDESIAREFAEELRDNYGVNALGIGCDVSAPTSVNRMVDKVVLECGEINILHNNAAWKSKDLNAFNTPFEEYSLETWREIMSVNIDGMFLVAQAVGKQMVKQRKGGSIIQTSSIYGIMAPDNSIYEGPLHNGKHINTPAVYSASKGAVIALTKYLATYWASNEIRVNTLTPGGVKNGQNEEFVKRYSNRIPLKRMAAPDEIVGALVYLASDASSYVTGQNVIVDGGLSAW